MAHILDMPRTYAPHITTPRLPATPHALAPAGTSVNDPAGSAPSGIGVGNPYGPLGTMPGVVGAQNQRDAANAQAAAFFNQQAAAARYRYNGAGNPYSQLALLKQQDADATRAYINNLAARGILASGETGYQQGEEAKRYGASLYDAQNALNDLLGGYRQQYIGQTNQNNSAFNDALNEAWQTYSSNPDPSIYGNWTSGTLPNGKQGTPFQYAPSPYVNPVTGGSLITGFIK